MIAEFSAALVLGIFSSALVLAGDRFIERRKLRLMFEPLAGLYWHYDMAGNRLGDWETVITYAGGSTLNTHARSSQHEWQGQIVMNEYIPGFGTGSYIHMNRADCGLHQVQADERNEVIFVLWTNTSHIAEKRNEGSYVWKRVKE